MYSPIVLAFIYFPLLISCVSGLKNVKNLQQFIATEKIQAEIYTSATYANIYDDCTQDPSIIYLGDLSTGTVLEYDLVDFDSGVQRVSLRVANIDPSRAVDISMHVSSVSGTSILTIPVNPTGSDKCAFVTLDVALEYYPAGKQNLYLTIPSGDGGQLFLDWFQFNRTSGGIKPATEIIQAEDFDYADEEVVVYTNCTAATIVANAFDAVAEYFQVDFGVGVQSVRVRGYTGSFGGSPITVSFHLGSASSPPFATVDFSYPADRCNFSVWSAKVNVLPTGVQTLFFVMDDSNMNVDWFVFVREEAKWNATEQIEAEDFTSATNVSLYEDCGNGYVGALQSNSVLEFDGVDFGSGVDTVTLRVSNIRTGAPLNVTLHLGSSYTTPLVNVYVGPTGTGRCDFFTITTFLNAPPSGIQNLFFTFPSPGGYLNLDWFVFDQIVN